MKKSEWNYIYIEIKSSIEIAEFFEDYEDLAMWGEALEDLLAVEIEEEEA